MSSGEWRYRFHSGAPAPEDYRSAHAELVEVAEAILRECGLPELRFRTAGAPASAAVPAHAAAPARAPSAETRLPAVYGRTLAARARRDDRIVALDADLMLDTGLIPFAAAHGDRYIECGIAEQDMVSIASGLASRGMIPFVHSFSCFLHARPNEQIYNNATEGRRVVYVGSLAGILPAGPGHSHQAVRDVSAVAAIPGLVVLEPASPDDVRHAVDFCLTTDHSVYLRLVSAPCAQEILELPSGPLEIGRGRVIRRGGRAVAIGSGPVLLAELLGAARLLEAAGIDLTVVDLPWLNRVDADWLAELCDDAEQLVVVENHFTRGGQADVLARSLLELRPARIPAFHGIGLTEIPRCGTAEEALDAHGLSSAHLARAIRDQVRGDCPHRSSDVALRAA